jgi:DNA mismatch endonuclease, patch repair protein
MADVFTKKKRSEVMSKIRSKDTKVEKDFLKILSKELYPKGYRYRKNYKKLPGSPDIVFVKYKLAIFIDGDFWHGYNFKKRRRKLPLKYWVPKIEKNMKRDKENTKKLKKLGWKVIRIWEHEVQKKSSKYIESIRLFLDQR